LTLHGDEADFLAFFQALEAVAFDRAEVHDSTATHANTVGTLYDNSQGNANPSEP
jgi:hypothetical protein